MRLGRVAVICAVFVFFPPISSAETMSLPGQFAVSETGAATYSIPIEVPPGVAGMEPKLALIYNSQSGNGLLGMGWSLSGLSAITRCPRTMAQDGVRGGINYDLNDRYCLDGQRLILVSGTEGGHGAEYRTERESFNKIVAYTDPANSGGPAKFLVKTKAGLIMEYGYTSDSRVEAQGKTSVRIWAVNKLVDARGNNVDFNYFESNSDGEHYPISLTYDGVGGPSSQRQIVFQYQPRLDVISGYQASSKFKIGNRLTKLLIKSSANMTGYDYDYRVEYAADNSNTAIPNVSRVKTIGFCTSNSDCTLSLSTNMSNLMLAASAPTEWANGNDWAGRNWMGFSDFNGDGRQDLWFVNPNSFRVMVRLSVGSGFAAATEWADGNNWTSRGWMGFEDFNGDGRDDLWFVNPDSSRVVIRLSTGFSFAPESEWANGNNWASRDWMGFEDFNNDGRKDLWFANPNSSRLVVRLSTGSSFSAETEWANGNAWASYLWKGFADFNGDGLPDLWFVNPSSSRVVVRLSTGTSFAEGIEWASSNNWAGYLWMGFLDFNGDGMTDLWFVNPSSSRILVRLSTGRAFAAETEWASSNNWAGYQWLGFGDFNGDRLPDLWFVNPSSSRIMVRLNNGSSFKPEMEWASSNNWAGYQWLGFADFNGDGSHDLWFVSPSSYQVMVRTSVHNFSGELSGINRGVDEISFNFDSIINSLGGAYQLSASASYPLIPTFGIRMLTSVGSSDGVGGYRQTNYRYGNALAELGTGRGFLGFEWMQSEDVSTGLVSRTWYRQDWPFVGLVDKVERGTSVSNRSNLGLTTYTYDCTDFDATPGCLNAPGKRYFPFVTRVEDRGWDLNGTALPITRTDTIHDCISTSTVCFGNALDLTVSTLNPDGSPSGYSKRTQSQFYNDTNNWILGRLIRSSVTHAAP